LANWDGQAGCSGVAGERLGSLNKVKSQTSILQAQIAADPRNGGNRVDFGSDRFTYQHMGMRRHSESLCLYRVG
jgi:hypothetical protein